MNWINNFINKKATTTEEVTKKDIPDNLWIKCPRCDTLLFKKDLSLNLEVCSNCDYHFFMPVIKRLEYLFNNAKYIDIKMPAVAEDPLKFKDKEKYSDRLKSHRAKTGFEDAIVAGYGKIQDTYAVVAVMNFNFMGGSMGAAVGEGFTAAVNTAINKKVPFVIITASGGARMQEGVISLMQMAKTTVMVEKLREANLPYIVILTNPTTGGVVASFAMIGDVHIAEKEALIGFAGSRVIEQTIRQKLPEGFQTAEYLLEHGMVDIVTHRSKLKSVLGNILDLLVKKDTVK